MEDVRAVHDWEVERRFIRSTLRTCMLYLLSPICYLLSPISSQLPPNALYSCTVACK
jgi:hypothetical protein